MTDSTDHKTVSLPWYADGLQFECTQCGNCCSGGPGYVWLTITDMENIAAFLNLAPETFTKTYVRAVSGSYSLIEKPDYDCIFLRRENGKSMCGIYPVRPTQCRTWPFWNENLKSEKAWNKSAVRCPGMHNAAAPKFDLAHIEKCRTNPESP